MTNRECALTLPEARKRTLIWELVGVFVICCLGAALHFALASGVVTVLCGMYSPLEIDTNLAFAGAAPDEAEQAALRREAEALRTGCLRWLRAS